MAVRFDVLPQRAGVCVTLQAAHHLAVVGLVYVVRACMFEAVAGVGVALVAALVGTNVGLFTCSEGRSHTHVRFHQNITCSPLSFFLITIQSPTKLGRCGKSTVFSAL